MKQKLHKLYAITDRELSNASHLEIVQMMIEGGAKLIQLRDKEAGSREMLDAARECLKITREAGALLIINDRVDIALASDANGVHLGQKDISVAEAREILGPDKIIGISTHNVDQILAALESSADYIALGPIYPTKTKDNPDPVVGLDLLREAKSVMDRPLVAIGGINLNNAGEVFAAGADSIAVISALYPYENMNDFMAKPDITGQVKEFIEMRS